MGSISSIMVRKPSHDEVWTNYYVDGDFHRCPVCQCNYIDKAVHTVDKNYGAWQRGYKISKSNGGSTHINNLVPICWKCNYLTGDQNIRDFAEKMGYNISPRI